MSDPHSTYLAELERAHRRNAICFYADGFLFLFGLALVFPSTILAGFVHHFSGSASAAATLTAIFLTGMALPQPFGAFLSHRRTRRKSLVVTLATLQKIPIFLLATFSLFAGQYAGIAVPVIFILFSVFSLFCGLVGPVWADWIGRVIDPRRRGRTLGFRTFWMSLGGLCGALVSQTLLERGGGRETYALLFHLAFISMSLTTACLILTVEMEFPRPTKVIRFVPFLKRLATVLRENAAYRRYVLAMTLFFVTSIVPAVAIWFATHRFDAADLDGWDPDRAAGRWNLVMWLVQALFGLAIGGHAQRHGPFPALALFGLSALAMPFLALLAPGPAWYSSVFVAFGVSQSAFFVAHLGTIYALSPGEDRLPYLAASELLKVPVLLATLLGGAMLLDSGDPTMVAWVIGLSALAPLVGLAIMPRVARESGI